MGQDGVSPDLATFRTLLTSWSKHRQDRRLAQRRARELRDWMQQLYKEGLLARNPLKDSTIRSLLDMIHTLAAATAPTKKMQSGRGGRMPSQGSKAKFPPKQQPVKVP